MNVLICRILFQIVSRPFKKVDPAPSASEVGDRLSPLGVDGTILKCLLGLDLHQSQDVLSGIDQTQLEYQLNKFDVFDFPFKLNDPSFRVISGLISCPVLSGSFPDFLAFCHSLTYLADDGEITKNILRKELHGTYMQIYLW